MGSGGDGGIVSLWVSPTWFGWRESCSAAVSGTLLTFFPINPAEMFWKVLANFKAPFPVLPSELFKH